MSVSAGERIMVLKRKRGAPCGTPPSQHKADQLSSDFAMS